MNGVGDKSTMKIKELLDKKILNKTVMKRLTAAAAVCTILSTVLMYGKQESEAAEAINMGCAVGPINFNFDINYIDNSEHYYNYNYYMENSLQHDEIPVYDTADTYGMESNIKAEEAIKELTLGMDKDYIIKFMGAPIFKLVDNGLCNLFFLLEEDDVVIRCVFSEDDSLVGCFVTLQKIVEEPDQALEFPNPMLSGQSLRYGYSTVADTESRGEESVVTANMGNGGEENYYWQRFHLLYPKGYDGFIVASLPYGFYEYESDKLMELISADGKRLEFLIAEESLKLGVKENEVLPYYKSMAHPNTYGVLYMKYDEKIDPCISESLEWEACLSALNRKR